MLANAGLGVSAGGEANVTLACLSAHSKKYPGNEDDTDHAEGEDYGPTFTRWDVVGCGVDITSKVGRGVEKPGS